MLASDTILTGENIIANFFHAFFRAGPHCDVVSYNKWRYLLCKKTFDFKEGKGAAGSEVKRTQPL